MKFWEKLCPCKYVVEEEPSTLQKVLKGTLVAVGVVAGIAAVFTAVEVILVKFFKKCITITVQCTDLSACEEDGEETDEETVEEAVTEDVAAEEPTVEE